MPRAKKRSRQKKNKSSKDMLHLPASEPNAHIVVENGNQAKVGLESCCMVISPEKSPVYGGDEMVITVDNLNLPTEAEFFILYTGSNERRITRAHRINSLTFQANIPDHNLEEAVNLDMFYRHEKEEVIYQRVASGQFCYCYDSAHHLAQRLLQPMADEESIKLAVKDEELSTLDVRLRKALEYIASDSGWPNQGKTAACDKLLNFAAYFGLPQVASLVLQEIGAERVFTTDSNGQTPRDIALAQGHNHIADILTSNTRTLMKSENLKFKRNGVVIHKNRNGAISIATMNIHEDTLSADIELLKSIESDMASGPVDIECDGKDDTEHLGKKDNDGKDLELDAVKTCTDLFKNPAKSEEEKDEEDKEKADSVKSIPEEENKSCSTILLSGEPVNNTHINEHLINTDNTSSTFDVNNSYNNNNNNNSANEVTVRETTVLEKQEEEEEDDSVVTKQLSSSTNTNIPDVASTDTTRPCDSTINTVTQVVALTDDTTKASDEVVSSVNSQSPSIDTAADNENKQAVFAAVSTNNAGGVDNFLEEDLSSDTSDEIIDFSPQENFPIDITTNITTASTSTTTSTDVPVISTQTAAACSDNNDNISTSKSPADSKTPDCTESISACVPSVEGSDAELPVTTSNEALVADEKYVTVASADSMCEGHDLESNIANTPMTSSSSDDLSNNATQMLTSLSSRVEPPTEMPISSTTEIENSSVISLSSAPKSKSNVVTTDSLDKEELMKSTMPESSTPESITSTTMPDSSTSDHVTFATTPDSSIDEGLGSSTMPESSSSEPISCDIISESVTTESLFLSSPVSDTVDGVEPVTPSSTSISLESPINSSSDTSPPQIEPQASGLDTSDEQSNVISMTSDVLAAVSHEAPTITTSQEPTSDVTSSQPSSHMIPKPDDTTTITTTTTTTTTTTNQSSAAPVSDTDTTLVTETCFPVDSTIGILTHTDPGSVTAAEPTVCSVCQLVTCKCEKCDIPGATHQAGPLKESVDTTEHSHSATTSTEEISRENSDATTSCEQPPLEAPSPNNQTTSPSFLPPPTSPPAAAVAASNLPTPSSPSSTTSTSSSSPPIASEALTSSFSPPPPFSSSSSPTTSAPPSEAAVPGVSANNNPFSKLSHHESSSSDSPFQEFATSNNRILKGEPLSNGHTVSSLNLNCDLGSLGVLDTLLEERETSEEPVEKSPMVLTESIEAVRCISRHLQKLRNNGLGLGQNVKHDHLQRYRSCPILDAHDRAASPSASEESVHHRSMLDLAPGAERQSTYSDIVFSRNLSPNLSNSDLPHQQQQQQQYDPSCGVDSNESGVRICINGVTVGTSSDSQAVSTAPTTDSNFPSAVSELVKSTAECVQGTEAHFAAAVTGRDKVDYDSGPVSAGEHVGSGVHRDVRGHQRTHSEIPRTHRSLNYIRSTMASSLSGKSHSLNSLTGAEESDEDSFHDARENPTPSQSMMNLSTMSPDGIHGHQRHNNSGDSYSYGKHSFTDCDQPPVWPDTYDYQKMVANNSTTMPSPEEGLDSPDSVFVPSSPYPVKPIVNFAKSSSTSCLPSITEGSKGILPLKMRPNKQYFTQKLEDNEKFRRQQEFEEIDEVAEINKEAAEPRKNRDKKDSGKNFHDLLISSRDDKDKEKSEEKKKKSSNVLAKFGSTRKKFKKGKDGKEKENKHKNAHQFVSLSISNTLLCHVCNKSMANKAAVRCENCLINAHESSCKEQIPPCTKPSKTKATLQEGTNHGLREKQYPTVPILSSKTLDNSKRSSAPVWSSGGNLSQSWPDQRISEEREEFGSNRPESVHSNIGEIISESMESLDEHGVDQTVLESDPFLCMEENEPEAWNVSVEKKVVKKLSSKEVKRQDHIYELILTEKKYCQKLKIMQKIIYVGLLNEVGVSQDSLDVMFPCLDELLAIHLGFLSNLQQLQAQNKDKIVDEIGKTLVEQFDGESSERIKSAYGHFCSHHKESANVYKDLKSDRRVLSFVKRWSSNSLFEKREIPDFLLIVSHRLTKYPTMIESILKNTKEKKERDNLNLALEHIKHILTNVNSQVEEYERAQHLEEIIQRIDPRSSAQYRGRKFRRNDLGNNYRKLIHDGEIGWKTARGKVIDVTAVVLTDLIILMQENNQKYTFTMQDNKSCVIPLYELLVREKGDTKDCKGIYLISKRQTTPEMYELVCKSTEDMKSWINHLSYAVSQCSRDVPVEATQSFKKIEEQKIMEIRTRRMRQIIEKMKNLDQEIIRCCDDKKGLHVEYADLVPQEDGLPTIISSALNTSTLSSASSSTIESVEKLPLKEDGIENDYLQYALKEITKLTKVLQESSACLMSPVGGGTDHLGSSYSTHAVPKRAETFAGFDSDLRKDPGQKRPHSYVNQEGRSASMFNLHDSDSPGSKKSAVISFGERWNSTGLKVTKDSLKMNNRKSTGYIQSMASKHHTLDNPDTNQTANLAGMALLGCVDVPPPPPPPSSSTSDTSSNLTPPPLPQPPAVLNQNTAQIYHFLHTFLPLSCQQNTMIEDLKLQLVEAKETICKINAEKSEISKHSQLEDLRNLKEDLMRERENLQRDTLHLEKEREDLESQKEELHRGKITLQKQIDLFMERRNDSEGRRQSDRTENPEPPGFDGDSYYGSIEHKRSASADLASQASDDSLFNKDYSSRPGSKSNQVNSSSGGKTCAIHLISATNQQRTGDKLQQFLPLKLADNNLKGASQSQHHSGLGRSVSSSSFTTGKDSGNLSQVKKLAEPPRSAPKDRLPNHPAAVQPKSEPTESDVIYF